MPGGRHDPYLWALTKVKSEVLYVQISTLINHTKKFESINFKSYVQPIVKKFDNIFRILYLLEGIDRNRECRLYKILRIYFVNR